MQDDSLHFAAAAVFAKCCQAQTAENAGREYAEFYFRFVQAYSKRTIELENDSEDYRYGDILTAGRATQPGQSRQVSSAPPPPINPEPPNSSGDQSGGGRTF